MILHNQKDCFEYGGKTYFIGEEIVAENNTEYGGLFGKIIEIRTDADKETDNETPDIYCSFDPPVFPKEIEKLENSFSKLYRIPRKLDDIALDSVIMAPDMIKNISENPGEYKITIYSVEEDWVCRDDYGHSTEVLFDYSVAKKKLCDKIKIEKDEGCIDDWNDEDGFIEDYGDDYYEAYIDGYYASSHYLANITSHKISVTDSAVLAIAQTYIEHSRIEDFISQIEEWDEVEKLTDEQYKAMISDKSLLERIQNALSKNDAYWEAYWESISELAFKMVDEYSKKQIDAKENRK